MGGGRWEVGIERQCTCICTSISPGSILEETIVRIEHLMREKEEPFSVVESERGRKGSRCLS